MFDIQNVRLDNRTIFGAQYHLLELDTLAVTKKPTKAQFEIKNFQNNDRRIFGLSFTPDAIFSSEGIIEIRLNGVRLLPIEAPIQGMLRTITALNIPIPTNFGLRISESKKLEVFIWNPDGNSAKINLSCFIGDIKNDNGKRTRR